MVPVFGCKNRPDVDRTDSLIRRFAMTHAGCHNGGQRGTVLDEENTTSDAWAGAPAESADTALGHERTDVLLTAVRAAVDLHIHPAPSSGSSWLTKIRTPSNVM